MSSIRSWPYHVDSPSPTIGVSGGPIYTLTASVSDDAAAIVEYRWDVGDGLFRYGSSITYSYPVDKAEKFIRLRVTDSHGRQGFCFTCLG